MEWNQVAFSDESRFNLSSDGNRVRVWTPRGERLNPAFPFQQHTALIAGGMARFSSLIERRREDILKSGGVKLGLTGGRNRNLLCFLMKAIFVLMPVMAVFWLKGSQMSVCRQPLCSRNTTLDLQSGKQFAMTERALL
ncbi:hypothetical protein TNCV_4589961 [Trichonephila clavipes]|nr:hypothetical protein TNCV_4589961 [Trichonephila clavipes]